MNYEDFLELFESDRHELSDLIRKGEVPFDICLEANGRMSLPLLLLTSMLVHPNCTEVFFNVNYGSIVNKSGQVAKQSVLPKAKVLENLSCIQTAVKAKEPTIESIIKEWDNMYNIFKQLFKNPYIPRELKSEGYKLTKDDRLLDASVRDTFIF